MKTKYILASITLITLLAFGCSEESDMAIERVAAPVVVDVIDTAPDEVTAIFYELDKSGILDHTVGIDSIPVSGLSVEVFAASASMGVFTTDADGAVILSYTGTKPNEYAGTHKGIAFRIKK